MSKTIEEAAREYYLNEVVNGDTCDDKDGWTDCFVSGAAALMQLPLASRLTAEERETFREIYGELRRKWWETRDKYDELKALGKIEMMERIFGADFFKEEE